MKQKKQFIKPAVLQEITLLPDAPILQASVSTKMTVTTTGQEVKDYNFSDSSFNHDWE